ncbi:MAG: hypothetical protein KBD65_04005 [Candidatus Moranbacteria bacterium]|nr:hypothetical protein [Candidatus Moranbacteria bacterium]
MQARYWMRGFVVAVVLTVATMAVTELHKFFFELEGRSFSQEEYVMWIVITWGAVVLCFSRFGSLPRGTERHSLLGWGISVVAPVLIGWYLVSSEAISFHWFIGLLTVSFTFLGYNMVVSWERALRQGSLPK